MALGELAETRNHLRDGAQSGHIGIDELRSLWHLTRRARLACDALVKYLTRCIETEEDQKRNKSTRRKPPARNNSGPPG